MLKKEATPPIGRQWNSTPLQFFIKQARGYVIQISRTCGWAVSMVSPYKNPSVHRELGTLGKLDDEKLPAQLLPFLLHRPWLFPI